MTERRPDAGLDPTPDPYWRHDVAIETPPSYELTGGFGFRFKVHEATERYGRSHEDLVQLTGPGTRSYFHGKPYQIIADHHLTVDLFAVPPANGRSWDRPIVELGRFQASGARVMPRAGTTPRTAR